MPMYQTKTIASILEPVAQQVSKLIILHEEGEDGNSMPDLEVPVQAVSKAVANLVRVGRDTINSSQDMKMKTEMPKSLNAIERACESLEMASGSLKADPYSQAGRDKLIEGSRGILQGTTNMLIIFDESQVRKLCRDCKKVLDYLAISEVIETIEDLVQFVKDLSPCLSKVSHDVDTRRKELLNPVHRESLGQHLEQIKTLAPILICSMKIFIQIMNQEGKGTDEAIENRNYLSKRMMDEISEVIRVLEETQQTDEASRMNGANGVNLGDMSFVEIVKKVSLQLSGNGSMEGSQTAIQHIVELGYKVTDGFDGQTKTDLLELCNELDRVNHQVGGNITDQLAKKKLADIVKKLENRINNSVITRIIQDMADISTPLKQFTDAVLSTEAITRKRDLVEQKGQSLSQFSIRLTKTANIVAFSNARTKRRYESLVYMSSQVQHLTPQLLNAGTIKMTYPENKAADENFENLRNQFAAGVQAIRDLCDESIDIKTFLKQTEEHIHNSIAACEEGIKTKQSQSIVESTTLAARLSNRLLMALARESENSEDVSLKKQVNQAADRLKSVIAPFVESSKSVAINMSDTGHHTRWRSASNNLLEIVQEVQKLFSDLNMFGLDSSRQEPQMIQVPVKLVDQALPPVPPLPAMEGSAPPRPPLPQDLSAPPRPPMPESDDEEGLFTSEPGMNRPIHMAAHGLYQEVKQWDHTDNEIIGAAKKIAYLMAHLSELIRGGKGTKRELIACAKALADASERITDLAKELARHCTDKKIRTNLLQVCEKIPTLGTQLRVLSTVKATMMGVNMDTEEDQEAMGMLVFNAQKLNQAVKETVRAAEAASIRVRSDAGFKLRWVRKQPWFQ